MALCAFLCGHCDLRFLGHKEHREDTENHREFVQNPTLWPFVNSFVALCDLRFLGHKEHREDTKKHGEFVQNLSLWPFVHSFVALCDLRFLGHKKQGETRRVCSEFSFVALCAFLCGPLWPRLGHREHREDTERHRELGTNFPLWPSVHYLVAFCDLRFLGHREHREDTEKHRELGTNFP